MSKEKSSSENKKQYRRQERRQRQKFMRIGAAVIGLALILGYSFLLVYSFLGMNFLIEDMAVIKGGELS